MAGRAKRGGKFWCFYLYHNFFFKCNILICGYIAECRNQTGISCDWTRDPPGTRDPTHNYTFFHFSSLQKNRDWFTKTRKTRDRDFTTETDTALPVSGKTRDRDCQPWGRGRSFGIFAPNLNGDWSEKKARLSSAGAGVHTSKISLFLGGPYYSRSEFWERSERAK